MGESLSLNKYSFIRPSHVAESASDPCKAYDRSMTKLVGVSFPPASFTSGPKPPICPSSLSDRS